MCYVYTMMNTYTGFPKSVEQPKGQRETLKLRHFADFSQITFKNATAYDRCYAKSHLQHPKYSAANQPQDDPRKRIDSTRIP